MRKQRVISAIVLIALAAAATALGSYVLGALILVFICMGIYEIYKAFENKGFRPVYAIGFCFAVLFLLQTVFQTPEMMNLYIGDTFLGGENGVLKGLLTTKKTAEQYGLPDSGTADAPYDGVPSVGFHGFSLAKTAESLKDLVPGKAVFMLVASGGDMTPDGHFATPVQLAFLLEDGKPVGRLPEISVGGNFFDMLGKDYLGTVYDWPFRKFQLAAVTMDVNKN